jgi:hypothetical protein
MSDDAQERVGEMHKRRTTLADGRYLIYYTFGDEPDASVGSGPSESREAESKPEPGAPRAVAEEERSV